jgi:SAM-dependent methyltransferase
MTLSCRICSSPRLHALEQRSGVPILLNRLYATRDAARAVPLGRIDLVSCEDCGFTSNVAFDPALIVYDDHYENDQAHSPAFSDHIAARVQDVLRATPENGDLDFLEIGCGQGHFIGEIARAAGAKLKSAEGFDPAWRGNDGEGPSRSRIHKSYFDRETAAKLVRQPNVVASRHTIEHVPQPLAFLTSLRAALGPSSRARVFIETPCVAWILDKRAMQDFFYEHCSLFTASSLGYALQRAGFEVIRVDHVFGGQYLWAEAVAALQVATSSPKNAGIGRLAGAYEQFQKHWRETLQKAHSNGPIALWGAGAKGVTFALMIDPSGQLIDHAIDINPAKQGRHLPGSGLAVLSPKQSAARNPRTIVVMNPNYIDEIRAQAATAGIAATFIALDTGSGSPNK